MKYKTILIISFGLTLSLIWGFSGCSLSTGGEYLKNKIIGSFDSRLENFSRHALPREKDPQDEEFLSSGIVLKRKAGNRLTMTYTLTVTIDPENNYNMLRRKDFQRSLELTVE